MNPKSKKLDLRASLLFSFPLITCVLLSGTLLPTAHADIVVWTGRVNNDWIESSAPIGGPTVTNWRDNVLPTAESFLVFNDNALENPPIREIELNGNRSAG